MLSLPLILKWKKKSSELSQRPLSTSLVLSSPIAQDKTFEGFTLAGSLALIPSSIDSQSDKYHQDPIMNFIESTQPWFDDVKNEVFSDFGQRMSHILEEQIKISSNYGHYISLLRRRMDEDSEAYAPNLLKKMRELLESKEKGFIAAKDYINRSHCNQEIDILRKHHEDVMDLRKKYVGLRKIHAQSLADEARKIIKKMTDRSEGLADYSLSKTTFDREPLVLFLILPQRSFASSLGEKVYLEAIGNSFLERVRTLSDPLREQTIELRIFTEYRAGENLGQRRGSLLGGYTPEDWARITPRLIRAMQEEGFTHTAPLERALLRLRTKASSCVGRLYWRKSQEWVYKITQTMLAVLNSNREQAPLHLTYYPTQGHVTLNNILRAEWNHRKTSAKEIQEGTLPSVEKARSTSLEKKILPHNCLYGSYELYRNSYALYEDEADQKEAAKEQRKKNSEKIKKSVPGRKKKAKFLTEL